MMAGAIAAALGCAAVAEAAGQGKVEAYMALMQRSNGVYSVFEAARAGDIAALQARLAEGDSANGRNEQGDTPLHLAAAAGRSKVVARLLTAGADPLAKDAAGRIPSQVAANKACLELCKKYEALRRREIDLFPAVRENKADVVLAALKKGVSPNALSEDCSLTLLGAAVQAGAVETAQTLLQRGAQAGLGTPGGMSPLHIAAARGNAQMVNLLLAAGADPMAKSGNGSLPIHEAIWNGRTEAALALIPAYKSCGYTPNGGHHGIPVCMAIGRNNAAVVQGFLAAGMNPNDPVFAKEPLLVQAARRNNAEMVRSLLHAGADKNATDAQGKRAADYATGAVAELLK